MARAWPGIFHSEHQAGAAAIWILISGGWVLFAALETRCIWPFSMAVRSAMIRYLPTYLPYDKAVHARELLSPYRRQLPDQRKEKPSGYLLGSPDQSRR